MRYQRCLRSQRDPIMGKTTTNTVTCAVGVLPFLFLGLSLRPTFLEAGFGNQSLVLCRFRSVRTGHAGTRSWGVPSQGSRCYSERSRNVGGYMGHSCFSVCSGSLHMDECR